MALFRDSNNTKRRSKATKLLSKRNSKNKQKKKSKLSLARWFAVVWICLIVPTFYYLATTISNNSATASSSSTTDSKHGVLSPTRRADANKHIRFDGSNIIKATTNSTTKRVNTNYGRAPTLVDITNTTTALLDNDNNDTRPYFILHIGPPKTATTTIQCGLEEYSQLLAVGDNTYFLGAPCQNIKKVLPNGDESIMGGLVNDLRNYQPKSDKLRALQKRLQHHYNLSHHVILSMEGMSRRLTSDGQVNILAKDILQSNGMDWRVQIVMSYRHYFDWLPSLHYQQQNEDFMQTDLHNRRVRDGREPNGKFQRYRRTPFSDFLQQHLTATKGHLSRHDKGPVAKALGEHLSIRSYKLFSRNFNHTPIVVFDLQKQLDDDNGYDLETNFICQTIPTAKNLCQMLTGRKHHQPPKKQQYHKSQSADTVRLIEAAIDAKQFRANGAINITQELHAKFDAFWKEKIPNKLNSPFMTCLPEDMSNEFLNVSMGFEQEFLELQGIHDPARLQQAQSKHAQAFERQRQKGKFCELETAKLLQDPLWDEFLKKFENELHSQTIKHTDKKKHNAPK